MIVLVLEGVSGVQIPKPPCYGLPTISPACGLGAWASLRSSEAPMAPLGGNAEWFPVDGIEPWRSHAGSPRGLIPALQEEAAIPFCPGKINRQHSLQHCSQYATLKVSEETKERQ